MIKKPFAKNLKKPLKPIGKNMPKLKSTGKNTPKKPKGFQKGS
jgi:hypothetical protein